jgi:hypothetical protein
VSPLFACVPLPAGWLVLEGAVSSADETALQRIMEQATAGCPRIDAAVPLNRLTLPVTPLACARVAPAAQRGVRCTEALLEEQCPEWDSNPQPPVLETGASANCATWA